MNHDRSSQLAIWLLGNALKKVKIESVKWFKSSPCCQQLCWVDPSMPSSRFRKDTSNMAWWQASMFVQLRMGHVPWQKHLHRVGHASSLTCLACQSVEEMVQHYIMTCPAYTVQRKQLEGQLGRVARLLNVLLGNPKAFKYLFRFIHDTGHFHNLSREE